MVFWNLKKNRQAKEHLDKAVGVSIAIGNKELEARATVSLAHVFESVNDSQKAKEHCEKALTINRESGNRECEAQVYLSVGLLSQSFGEYDKAAYYLQKACSISSEIGHKMTDFQSLLHIAVLKISQFEVVEALEYLFQGIEKYEQIRTLQKGNSGFEISLLEHRGTFPYKLLTHLLCDTGRFRDALYVEELGRARVLAQLMADKYSSESHISADPRSWFGIENIARRESNCVSLYISYEDRQVLLWVLKANGDIFFRKTDQVKIDTLIAEQVCEVEGVFKKSAECFGVLPAANCEDRSLDDKVTTSLHEESQANLRGDETKGTGRSHHLCYEWIVAPVADLLTEPEIIIVPDRFSYRVPFAALRDEQAGKYLSEKYRIRIVPSLTTLRLIQESPADYHSQTGGLVVGDPTVGKVQYNGRLIDIKPLFCASKEAEMVGQLLGVQPLLGRRATKQAVLQAIPSVSLIHLAAHGNPERGEIALSPQCTTNSTPQEEDYLLTMSDIERVQVRAKLVVLSCCHSGRGLVKKEGVIGIARAFLASGARSVLVASWAIEDQATAKLMKNFYKHLVRGESASESLYRAVQWLRSNGFSKPSQWAPFVLMGDNVTFIF
ncbi:tetratricopeptide repeat protein 28-like [Pocillopora verrucosa]|uniref:tetratricopeptide repeat protein 28-like n=1 Tax=Pocillopora verrucosa TaxID=203993 RepID=UPI003341FFD9